MINTDKINFRPVLCECLTIKSKTSSSAIAMRISCGQDVGRLSGAGMGMRFEVIKPERLVMNRYEITSNAHFSTDFGKLPGSLWNVDDCEFNVLLLSKLGENLLL